MLLYVYVKFLYNFMFTFPSLPPLPPLPFAWRALLGHRCGALEGVFLVMASASFKLPLGLSHG